MADDTLAEQLALLLHRRHWTGHNLADCPGPTARERADGEAIVAWLAERGRLVPDGATVEEQWAAPDGEPDPFPALSERFARDYAEVAGVEPLRRRVITTPWEPVPATPEEAG